jgi:hypothetical protein
MDEPELDWSLLTPDDQRELGLAVGQAIREMVPTWVSEARQSHEPPDDLHKLA